MKEQTISNGKCIQLLIRYTTNSKIEQILGLLKLKQRDFFDDYYDHVILIKTKYYYHAD